MAGNMKTGRVMTNITKDRSRWFEAYSTVGADVDLYAEGPNTDSNGQFNNLPCAEIHVYGAGNLVVQRIDGSNVTLPVTAGAVLPISVRALIAAGTTATNIVVFW